MGTEEEEAEATPFHPGEDFDIEGDDEVELEARVTITEGSDEEMKRGDVLRIEAKRTVTWSGVSSCCKDSRVDDELESAFKKWVKDQLYRHRNQRWLRYGHNGGKGTCRRWRHRVTNERSCGGSLKSTFYIEFAK